MTNGPSIDLVRAFGIDMRPPSREAYCCPSFAKLPQANEGSGAPTGARVRRHPLLYADHSRDLHASPRRDGFHRVCAPGDARLSALHRGGLLASSPPGQSFRTLAYRGGCPNRLTMLRSQVPPVVAGGRCRSKASRALVCMHQLAGRRIPAHSCDASRRAPSVAGTAWNMVLDRGASMFAGALCTKVVGYLERELWRAPPRHDRIDRF
jgi:hypothetical protein